MRDARGDALSICTSRIRADELKLPTSAANPLDEDGPPPPEGDAAAVEFAAPAGLDRINLVIEDANHQPCIVAIPKGYSVLNNPPISTATSVLLVPTEPVDSPANFWYTINRYGIQNLANWSLNKRDKLFVYAGLEKAPEFTATNCSLSGRFTTISTHLTQDNPIYNEIVARVRIERDTALVAFGTKQLEVEPPAACYATPQMTAPPGAPTGYAASPFDLGNAFENMAKIMVDSNHKLTTVLKRKSERSSRCLAFLQAPALCQQR